MSGYRSSKFITVFPMAPFTFALTFQKKQTIEITALKSNRANQKCLVNVLSVANDSDKILEKSDNWSYVFDQKYN